MEGERVTRFDSSWGTTQKRDRWPRDRGTENHSFFSLDGRERERKKDRERGRGRERERKSLSKERERKKSEGKDFFGRTFTWLLPYLLSSPVRTELLTGWERRRTKERETKGEKERERMRRKEKEREPNITFRLTFEFGTVLRTRSSIHEQERRRK